MILRPEFSTAMSHCLRLRETLGEHHPGTVAALLVAMELAPAELIEEFHAMATDMGLMPETSGYLEDGTPLFKASDIGERLGMSAEETEDAVQALIAERERLGLSNAGIVTDAAMIHRMQ